MTLGEMETTMILDEMKTITTLDGTTIPVEKDVDSQMKEES